MIEIRRHGRGGLGAVTASSVLVEAAYLDGLHGQAFPFFGAERRGAPVLAFTRIDNKPIKLHSQIYEPDIVVVLDSSLLEHVDITQGLKEGGRIVINTAHPREERAEKRNVAYVNATQIARDLGLVMAGRPLVNMPMIGALVRATNVVSLDSALKAIYNRFAHRPEIAKKNVDAAKRAYEEVKIIKKR